MNRRSTAASKATAHDERALARDLLHVSMRMMHSLATALRRQRDALEPGQMATVLKLAVGPATVSDLARHRGVSVPTVSRSIDVLVERGWVERWDDPSDRRHTLVRLTLQGKRVTAAMRDRSERHVAELLAPLSPAQRRDLARALDALKQILPRAADR